MLTPDQLAALAKLIIGALLLAAAALLLADLSPHAPDRSDSNINKNTSRSFSKGEGGGLHADPNNRLQERNNG